MTQAQAKELSVNTPVETPGLKGRVIGQSFNSVTILWESGDSDYLYHRELEAITRIYEFTSNREAK